MHHLYTQVGTLGINICLNEASSAINALPEGAIRTTSLTNSTDTTSNQTPYSTMSMNRSSLQKSLTEKLNEHILRLSEYVRLHDTSSQLTLDAALSGVTAGVHKCRRAFLLQYFNGDNDNAGNADMNTSTSFGHGLGAVSSNTSSLQTFCCDLCDRAKATQIALEKLKRKSLLERQENMHLYAPRECTTFVGGSDEGGRGADGEEMNEEEKAIAALVHQEFARSRLAGLMGIKEGYASNNDDEEKQEVKGDKDSSGDSFLADLPCGLTIDLGPEIYLLLRAIRDTGEVCGLGIPIGKSTLHGRPKYGTLKG